MLSSKTGFPLQFVSAYSFGLSPIKVCSFCSSMMLPLTLSLPAMNAFCGFNLPAATSAIVSSSRVSVTCGLLPSFGSPRWMSPPPLRRSIAEATETANAYRQSKANCKTRHANLEVSTNGIHFSNSPKKAAEFMIRLLLTRIFIHKRKAHSIWRPRFRSW